MKTLTSKESSFNKHCTICKNLHLKDKVFETFCLKGRNLNERKEATRRCKDLQIARTNSKKRLELDAIYKTPLEEIYREGK